MYSKRLCQAVPGLRLYGIDCWTTIPGYREHISQEKLDEFREIALNRTAPYDCTLIKEWSVEAAKQFKDGSLDFVYIDGCHSFADVVKDIDAWAPKVRKDGIVAGHDYIKNKNKKRLMHVVQAVKGWTECYQISPWFILGRKDKVSGELRDDKRSWMWVQK